MTSGGADENRKYVGKKIITLKSVPSTNQWFLDDKKRLSEHGLALISDHQTRGRGRFNRTWDGGNERQLYCSLLIHPDLPPNFLPSITLLIGIAVYESLSSLGLRNISLKWPNDVLINNKKVCGILCEMRQVGANRDPVVVAGIGVNISGKSTQFPRELHNKVTTLEQEGGTKVEKHLLFNRILNQVDYMLSQAQSNRFNELFEKWESVSSSLGKEVSWFDNETRKSGKIVGLNNSGCLIVKSDAGVVEEILSGEISYL